MGSFGQEVVLAVAVLVLFCSNSFKLEQICMCWHCWHVTVHVWHVLQRGAGPMALMLWLDWVT
jgi:hypothetical protein